MHALSEGRRPVPDRLAASPHAVQPTYDHPGVCPDCGAEDWVIGPSSPVNQRRFHTREYCRGCGLYQRRAFSVQPPPRRRLCRAVIDWWNGRRER